MKSNNKSTELRARAAEKLLANREPELLAILNTLTAAEQNQMIEHLERDELPKSRLRRFITALGIGVLIVVGCYWQPTVFPVVAVVALMSGLLLRQRREIRLKSEQLRDKNVQLWKARDKYHTYKREMEERYESATSELEEANRAGESISRQLYSLEQESEILRDKVEQAHLQIEAAKKQIQQLSKKVDSLTNELSQAHEQIESVSNMNKMLNTQAAHTRVQVKSLTECNLNLTNDLAAVSYRCQVAEKQKLEAVKELASLRRDLAEALQELEQLRAVVLKQQNGTGRGRWRRIFECAMNLKCLPKVQMGESSWNQG
jgi:flagellar biosynthesis chaperone FliJ